MALPGVVELANVIDLASVIDVLAASLPIATPLVLAALDGILCERAGTFAVGLEGQMLAGAFLGVIGTHAARASASVWRLAP